MRRSSPSALIAGNRARGDPGSGGELGLLPSAESPDFDYGSLEMPGTDMDRYHNSRPLLARSSLAKRTCTEPPDRRDEGSRLIDRLERQAEHANKTPQLLQLQRLATPLVVGE